MTVRELMKLLSEVPGEYRVVLQEPSLEDTYAITELKFASLGSFQGGEKFPFVSRDDASEEDRDRSCYAEPAVFLDVD